VSRKADFCSGTSGTLCPDTLRRFLFNPPCPFDLRIHPEGLGIVMDKNSLIHYVRRTRWSRIQLCRVSRVETCLLFGLIESESQIMKTENTKCFDVIYKPSQSPQKVLNIQRGKLF